MELSALKPADRLTIDAYGDGGFRVAGKRIEGGLLLYADQALPWPVTGLDMLSPESLAPLRDTRVTLLLLGCGEKGGPIPKAVTTALQDKGITIEPMGTGAAARTYNLLAAENRAVAAALIAV